MLRKELQPPKINYDLVKELMKLIDEISNLTRNFYEAYYIKKEKTILNEKIDCFNSIVEKKYEPLDFVEYWSSKSLENVAKKISLPNPPTVDNITIEEVTKIIEMIVNLKPAKDIEETKEIITYVNYYVELLEKSIPNKNISNLICWYSTKDNEHQPTPKEIAEKAFKTKDII